MRIRTALVIFFLISSPAFALSNRVFVKSTGVDSGTCTLTAPCRSFGFAIIQVSPGGEVIALDTAGYGTFNVSQSVKVLAAPGVTAFIAVTIGTGIAVFAADSDRVVLRGLALSGSGAQIGINFENGASLSIENTIVDGFIDTGIELFREGTSAQMRIDHTTVRNCGTGISAGTIAVGLARVTITNSSSSENSIAALEIGDNARGVATDCVFANSQVGVIADSFIDVDPSQVSLERCTISGNTTGVQAGSGASAVLRGTVRIAHNQITANTLGVSQQTDGLIMTMTSGSLVTNTIEGNVTDGTFTGSYTAK